MRVEGVCRVSSGAAMSGEVKILTTKVTKEITKYAFECGLASGMWEVSAR